MQLGRRTEGLNHNALGADPHNRSGERKLAAIANYLLKKKGRRLQ
jgi:hypothetical protein